MDGVTKLKRVAADGAPKSGEEGLGAWRPDPREVLGPLYDAHCHLDFMSNGEDVARHAQADGMCLFANTATPSGYIRAQARFAPFENVFVGLGMHPWWVDDAFDGDEFERLALETRYIGEVGLDFGKRGEANRDAQLAAFMQIAQICARQGSKLLSIHAVRSASTILDILEESDTLATCSCIFHWFSGSSDELNRALKVGCYFSVNPMMLATRKGREYVRQLPAERLLAETDAPPGEDVVYDYAELAKSLESVRSAINDKRLTS